MSQPWGQQQGWGQQPPGWGQQQGWGQPQQFTQPQGWGPPAGGPPPGQWPAPQPGPSSPYGQSPYGQSPYGQPPYGQPGQPQWTQPGGGRQPRRRRNPLAVVFGLLAVVAVVALGALAFTALLGGTPSNQAYANEDYRVPEVDSSPPPLPDPPQTRDEAYTVVRENPLYRQTLAEPVRCETPDVAGLQDRQEIETVLNEYMACQMRVWGPAIEGAGYVAVRPSVTVYSNQISTACGTMSGNEAINAFYCGADQQVYYSTLLAQALPVVRERKVAELVLAHEFGHAIQGRTGIVETGHLLAQNAASKTEGLEWLRRLELQADCFSSEFMRSVGQSMNISQSDYDNFNRAWYAIGDDTLTNSDAPGNHGRAESRQRWGQLGLNTGDVGTCNTFTAPSGQVR